MRLHANCKINIGLDILRRREDGFHDLQTVMVPVVGLYDVVDLEPLPDTHEILFEGRGMVVDCSASDNLCVRAAELMQSRYATCGVSITLDKRVPFGAGLGGGSSDATAVILAMNEICGLGLGEEELIEIAAELGSDTAFFVRNSPQLCSGRGEIMESVELDLSGLILVLIKPEGVNISTREAYSGVKPSAPEHPLQELISEPISEWQGRIKNDFEPHIFESHPELARLKSRLLEAGALYAAMSGSGSTIYALFDDPCRAEATLSLNPVIVTIL